MVQAPRVDALFVEFQSALAGRYSLDHEIGRGGMGVVYLAREVQLDRFVAIKLLPPDRALDDGVRERFLREARTAAKLSHPNIIPIFSVDEVEQFVFYVMAYVDGETLGDRVRARGPLAAAEATKVLREVAWALGHAHAQGVVHRDVKPENILLERGSGRALVTDFGIAAAMGHAGGAVAGTPEYMSPEQALGGDIDERADVYGLGATAYFACSGHPPFTGARAVDVLAQQVATPAPALARAGLSVPRRLSHLIEKCLSKDPADRPQGTLQFAERLAAAVEERRETPAALRAFVKRDSQLIGPGGPLLLGYFGLSALMGLGMAVGPVVAVGSVALLGSLVPFSGMVVAARRLLRRGFAPVDVRVAFEHEIEVLREEFLASGRVERRSLERAAGIVTIVCGAAMGAVAIATVSGGAQFMGGRGALGGAVVTLGFFGGLLVRQMLRHRRPYAALESWSGIWLGRIGRLAFSLARRLGGQPQAGAATTHRATELAIGMAADELFASLPKATRRSLGDVPRIVASLQRDAATLRAHHDRLQEALAEAGDAATGEGYAEMRALRDEMGTQHREVVSTLERMRLDLLRLHAGAMTVEGVTTQFGLADDVAQEVRRLLDARGELERFLARK